MNRACQSSRVRLLPEIYQMSLPPSTITRGPLALPDNLPKDALLILVVNCDPPFGRPE